MVAEHLSDRVRTLARHHGIEESAVLRQAVERGIETLYREMLISRHLEGELTREEAVDERGAVTVDELDAAREAIEADFNWARQP
jgi:predicted DNA-binding protein